SGPCLVRSHAIYTPLRPAPPPSASLSYNATPTSYTYTLSLHDALPIYQGQHHEARLQGRRHQDHPQQPRPSRSHRRLCRDQAGRSEEHTSELQSRFDLVCRLLLEKKNERHVHQLASALAGRPLTDDVTV